METQLLILNMRKFLFFTLIFALSGCGSIFPSDENNTEEIAVETPDYFEKKQECAKMYDTISARIKEYNKDRNTFLIDLQEVFYSPKMNECLYVDTVNLTGWDMDPSRLKRIMSISSDPGSEPVESCEYVLNITDYLNIMGENARIPNCDKFDILTEEYKNN